MQHPNLVNHSTHKGIPWPLCVIVLMFIVPFLLAFLLYRFHEAIPLKTIQTGQLVTPPILVNTLPALSSLSRSFKSTSLRKWQLIYLEPVLCDTVCNNRLDQLKRIQLALGKEQHRVDLRTIRFTKLLTESLREIATENSILVIDPRGFLILIYPATAFNAKGLLEDMRRLLRFSHVG